MEFSKRSLVIEPSPLYNIFARVKMMEKKGMKVISLGVGEPYQKTPKHIANQGIEAIKKGKTGYISSIGSEELRELIAAKYDLDTSEVFVSHGAKTVLGVVMTCLVNEGDTVFIPAPFYPPFVEVAKSLGGKVVFIDTRNNEFRLTADMVEKKIKMDKKKPKVLLINTPNNPAGISYRIEELTKIARLAEKYGFTIVSDECYSNFSPLLDFTMRSLSDSVIAINSASKTDAMTGWRIGWAAANEPLVKVAKKYLDNFIGCPCAISDYAAQEALAGNGIEDFTEQREIIGSWIHYMDLEYTMDGSGIYVFPNMNRYMRHRKTAGSINLANYILDTAKVAVIPGIAFGEYDCHLRISYSVTRHQLRIGLAKMEQALKNIK